MIWDCIRFRFRVTFRFNVSVRVRVRVSFRVRVSIRDMVTVRVSVRFRVRVRVCQCLLWAQESRATTQLCRFKQQFLISELTLASTHVLGKSKFCRRPIHLLHEAFFFPITF